MPARYQRDCVRMLVFEGANPVDCPIPWPSKVAEATYFYRRMPLDTGPHYIFEIDLFRDLRK